METTAERISSGTERITKVENTASYATPILAALYGDVVKLIAYGDAPGHSQVCQYVNAAGMLTWVPSEHCQVIDTAYLPLSAAKAQQVRS